MEDKTLIIGLGFVGLTLAAKLSEAGNKIYGLERDNEKVNLIRNGRSHFRENGLDEVLSKVINNKMLNVSSDLNDWNEINFNNVIITVGTPLDKESLKPNYKYLLDAIRSIRSIYHSEQLIILRSTVSVGTSQNIVLPELKSYSSNNTEPLIAFCPERTIEGNALNELSILPQIIGANNKKSEERSIKLFETINTRLIPVENLRTAELIKLFNNTYRDMNFAIGNIFNSIAQSFKVNGLETIRLANLEYDRSKIAMPGLVGGPCLEKDPYILTCESQPDYSIDIILATRRYNESMIDKVISWVKRNNPQNNPVFISGIAFKGRPETSDLRGSLSVTIIEKLKTNGIEINLHDYCVNKLDLQELTSGQIYDDILDGIKQHRITLILNNHIKYGALKKQIASLDPTLKILDLWNNFNLNNSSNIITVGSYEYE